MCVVRQLKLARESVKPLGGPTADSTRWQINSFPSNIGRDTPRNLDHKLQTFKIFENNTLSLIELWSQVFLIVCENAVLINIAIR